MYTQNELVSFNAGKMTVKPSANGKFLITPDLKKGKICLSRGDDQLLHFQWMDRQSGTNPEDFIIFPDDASFSRVDTGREGDRVFLLQYKNSSRRFFFWMQVRFVVCCVLACMWQPYVKLLCVCVLLFLYSIEQGQLAR